ncbi:MAG: class I SAM-dependent methyltransferase [Nitrosarchaeum sp.]|nr:class I SAM-dependent methyltransferase [Nitrosarchaeum sp.]
MIKEERIKAHQMIVSPWYQPNPLAHLNNERDAYHINWTLKNLEKYNLKSVLDYGCFDGWLDFLLIHSGITDVTGIELVPSLVEAARRYTFTNNLTYKIYEGFLTDVVFDRTFDVVLCYEVLEHIPLEIVKEYIQILKKISKMMFVSLPNQKAEDNQPQHLWTPTVEIIKDLFGESSLIEYHEFKGIPGNWFINAF